MSIKQAIYRGEIRLHLIKTLNQFYTSCIADAIQTRWLTDQIYSLGWHLFLRKIYFSLLVVSVVAYFTDHPVYDLCKTSVRFILQTALNCLTTWRRGLVFDVTDVTVPAGDWKTTW